jgi:hypothetical protein
MNDSKRGCTLQDNSQPVQPIDNKLFVNHLLTQTVSLTIDQFIRIKLCSRMTAGDVQQLLRCDHAAIDVQSATEARASIGCPARKGLTSLSKVLSAAPIAWCMSRYL